MTYSLTITNHKSDPTYINGIKTWNDVTRYLKYELNQYAIGVHIYKFSSNGKTLGEKVVRMGNLYQVATSETDKILI